ncbi:MAG: hypothetical protein AMS17_06100, partial [Spirochaetes bacterium DG_61]
NGSLTINKDVDSHPDPDRVSSIAFKYRGLNNGCRRVRVSEVEAKNLAEVESRTEKQAAGATKPTEPNVKGKLVEYAWWMKKQGYADSTIKGRIKILKTLSRKGANVFDSESIKEVIAKQTWKESSKKYAVIAYSCFLQMFGLSWKPPIYRHRETMPFIPLEEEIDQLIACCGRVTATFLQGLKETGADPGEFIAIRWIDVDRKNRAIAINHPVKGHNPRVVHVSRKLIDMLEKLPKKGERLFVTNVDYMYKNFRLQRRKATRKLVNPRLEKITFVTLRHWKGTMEYHRTKDILHVKRVLGHKCIQSTMVYINLDQAYFHQTSEEFTVRIASDVKQACELVETGFEYITGDYSDGGKIFRKRK